MARCLLLTTSTSYRTEAFIEAARKVGTTLVLGSDRCAELAEAWSDEAFAALAGPPVETSLALDYRDPDGAAEQIARAAADRPLDAVVATDDRTAHIAALAGTRLGLRSNSPAAARTARDKSELRRVLSAAGVPSPRSLVFGIDAALGAVAAEVRAALGFPVVAKPLLLSASRGVMRANDEAQLAACIGRLHAILRTRTEYADGVTAARQILVEQFVPGAEVALEGILSDGALRVLALYDKPDPLDGPFFEETIYVTPSRHPPALQRAIEAATARAAAAIGLRHGPLHAELRLPPGGAEPAVVIEVAARSIGGLCARTLRFSLGSSTDGGDHALEELVLRHALGLGSEDERPSGGASGVMMMPVPAAGVLAAVHGVEAARAVPLIEDVVVTARPGERLVPLPEGASYPGFIFARAPDGQGPAAVEAALRAAWKELRFEVSPLLL